jgi:cytochrome c-type biogenesis protein CcmH/NrfF
MFDSPEILWGVGIVLLLIALIWGVRQSRTRNRANDPITEEATHQEYSDPANYPQKKRDLEKQTRPS